MLGKDNFQYGSLVFVRCTAAQNNSFQCLYWILYCMGRWISVELTIKKVRHREHTNFLFDFPMLLFGEKISYTHPTALFKHSIPINLVFWKKWTQITDVSILISEQFSVLGCCKFR